MGSFAIRTAGAKDAALVLHFIRQLAEYEGMADEVSATEEKIARSLKDGDCRAVIGEEDGASVAFALYFFNYSTFLGQKGLYVEDVFVSPKTRGKGYGKELFKYLAKTALDCGCGRMEWWCLDWNEPSIAFYKGLGARPMSDWTVYRLSGQELLHLSENKERKAESPYG